MHWCCTKQCKSFNASIQYNGKGACTLDHCAYPRVGLFYVCGVMGSMVKCVSVFETGHLIPLAFSESQGVSWEQRIRLSLPASILPKQKRSGSKGPHSRLSDMVITVCYTMLSYVEKKGGPSDANDESISCRLLLPGCFGVDLFFNFRSLVTSCSQSRIAEAWSPYLTTSFLLFLIKFQSPRSVSRC